jgi:hypothetical protein
MQLARDGIDEPSEVAKEIGCKVEEVYEAQRRLKYHGKQIRAEAEAEEAKRLAEVRKKDEARRRGPPAKTRKDEEGGTL